MATIFYRLLVGLEGESVAAPLLGGLIDVSEAAQKEMQSWDQHFDKVLWWVDKKGRVPTGKDDKPLNRWLYAQLKVFETGELNLVQSKKIAKLLNRFAGGRLVPLRSQAMASVMQL